MTTSERIDWIEHRVEAYLSNEDSPTISNPIHSTEIARQFGFERALVGGVTVWGWATPTILAALGPGWLDRGWAEFSFRQPTYPGDELLVTARRDQEDGAPTGTWSITMTNQDEIDCVRGVVGLGDAPWLDEVATPSRMAGEPAPDPRPALTLDGAPVGEDWRPMAVEISSDEARQFARDSQHTEDDLFHGNPPRLHPAWIAGRAERVMRHNFAVPSSMHTRSRVQHLAPAYAGQTVTSGAYLKEVYERRAHHFANFDVLVRGQDGTDLARLSHWTAFRIATPEERAAAGG